MSALILKNPHSVLEAIRTRPADVLEVHLPDRTPRDAWQQVVDAAKSTGIAVRVISPERVNQDKRRGDPKSGRAGGAEGLVRERQPLAAQDLFAGAREQNGLWLALDQVQDPHNLGAIFRSAAFFGVRGIVVTRHKSAPMTAVVYDVASGGVEYVPHAIEINLRQTLDTAKASGLWVLGTSEHVERTVWEVPHDRSWLLVLGNEESGLRRLTTETCDELCSVQPLGNIGSLNVSVAAGVVIAALTRI
ncbi:MAG: RNA methyltransferase [Planctomycetaceae bacterium]|nr:RNA methyltransferase [Planctomycetaceae bacterium]